ncbi:putative glycoside hydrolase [Clostridium grantii]|uniref:Glycoside-hydrolase family GH114 TIM-barrel domain-containing protein n=1 Tax=Clostridium grantii DSM 8605 TaxID=1121316 RepID=A0A1M5W0P2_9CLOT|nr:putative glycoside hydrolase [Clostridium grantii]SHH81047.1 hypothetical protein SAMN02745207_02602 [Clostridium grantii DSM 8605]
MNKKNILLIAIFIIVLCIFSCIYTSLHSRISNPLKEISSYRIYYRKIDENILEDMTRFDLLIVEGSFFEKKDVDYLKTNETKIVGYLSLMEVGFWDDILINKMKDSNYLTIKGEKVLSKSGKNYIGDISNENYQNALLEVLEERIMCKNMDGVFLDTIDWIDYYESDLETYKKLKKGYTDFVYKVKEKYPSIVIIQNRGLRTYKDYSSDFIDGILWENFSSPYINNDLSKIEDLKDFIETINEKKTKVLTISFDKESESKDFSIKMGWTHLQSQLENRYSKWDFSK